MIRMNHDAIQPSISKTIFIKRVKIRSQKYDISSNIPNNVMFKRGTPILKSTPYLSIYFSVWLMCPLQKGKEKDTPVKERKNPIFYFFIYLIKSVSIPEKTKVVRFILHVTSIRPWIKEWSVFESRTWLLAIVIIKSTNVYNGMSDRAWVVCRWTYICRDGNFFDSASFFELFHWDRVFQLLLPSPSNLCCISAQTLSPATTCSRYSLYQVWQIRAYSTLFVQLACWHTDISWWKGV